MRSAVLKNQISGFFGQVKTIMKVSGRQVAGARGLLGWSQAHLATAADMSERAINRWEAGETSPHQSTIDRVVKVIEAHGVEFTNGDQPGVRFKKRPVEGERLSD